jgi:predicted enzyme related to lactoylglutathione lyase
VGGYEVIENASSGRVSDFVLASKGYARATVRMLPEKHSQVQPTWLPFVRVSNVNESVALAKQLGGKVLLEPKPENLESRVAVVADPTGAAIGLLEWNPATAKGAR